MTLSCQRAMEGNVKLHLCCAVEHGTEQMVKHVTRTHMRTKFVVKRILQGWICKMKPRRRGKRLPDQAGLAILLK